MNILSYHIHATRLIVKMSNNNSPHFDEFRIVNLEDPRRCPYCQSNKWKWIETLSASPKTIGKSLLMLYECEKCGKEFIAAEKAQATIVKDASKCVQCGSKHIEKISHENADIALYFCKQCRCWMGVESN